MGDPREGGAEDEGPQLRVHRAGPAAQERPPALLQPGAQEGPRAHPRRQAGVRVARRPRVRRRGLGRSRDAAPPRRPLRPRHRSLLGHLRQRHVFPVVEGAVQVDDGGAESGGVRERASSGGDAGEGVQGVLQGQGLLRRRRRRDRGPRARKLRGVDQGGGRIGRHQPSGRDQVPGAGGVGRAVHGRGRRGGGDARTSQDHGALQGVSREIGCTGCTGCF